jgi:Platelet-activating factor acetylhydrolase, isoform II
VRWLQHFACISALSCALAGQTPPPTGAYAVGRTLQRWIDLQRDDPVAEEEGTSRELMIVIWYPGEPGPQADAPWMPAAFIDGEAYQLSQQLRPLTLAQAKELIGAIRSHSFEGLEVAKAETTYPVILFEPGYNINPAFYSAICEDLASHGNIVAAIAPTGWIAGVKFPGGRVVGRSRKLLDDPKWVRAMALPLWSGDFRFAIDKLGKLNRDRKSIFYQRLDMGKIGAFGQSFGGGAAILTGLRDDRVRAVADLDGGALGIVHDKPLRKPLLVMLHDRSPQYEPRSEDKERRARQIRGIDEISSLYRAGGPGFRVTIMASRHMTFSDEAVLMPWVPGASRVGAKTEDGEKTTNVIRGYVREFFGKFLSDRPSPLLGQAPGENGIAELQTTGSR